MAHNAIIIVTLLFIFDIKLIHSQLISPCPRLFRYETPSRENDRWYGVVTLLNDADLNGVWLRVIFDKPTIQLGNWFGEVVTKDNKEYLVKNPMHKLQAKKPYEVRFYVKYDANETPPRLVAVRLNARTVCPENGDVTEAPSLSGQLQTSVELSTTAHPVLSGIVVPTPGRPDGGQVVAPIPTDDDDYFQGDFSLIGKQPTGGVAPALDVACGTVVKQPRPLVTHGRPASDGDYPWHAALYHSKGIDLTYICGASLVSRLHLITVAHCVTRRKSHQPLNPDSLVVYLGKYYLRRWATPGIQDRHVERIVTHPKYRAENYSNDIAVIRLADPVDVTAYVRPVCLWEDSNVQLQALVGRVGTVVGWGFDENGRVTEQLTEAKMPIVSQETCIYSFPDFYSRFTSSKTFCAGFRNGTSVCNGDSGGGMVFPKANTQSSPIWQLRGLVSISVALQNQLRCDSTHFVVFTDVAKYLDWIRNALI